MAYFSNPPEIKKKIICTKFQIKHPHYNEVEPWHNDNFGVAVLPKSLVNEEAETKFCLFQKLAVTLEKKNLDACHWLKDVERICLRESFKVYRTIYANLI